MTREYIEPPDVEPICPYCGLQLNVFGHCRQCTEERWRDESDERAVAHWKGDE